jgi:eukaryotic-like serine/threonine-protein kinase
MDDFDVSKEYAADFKTIQRVARYEIICKLGQGATGIAYLAWDPTIKRNVALKVTKAETEKYRDIFLSEIQSAGRLSHGNVVSIYDAGVENDSCYIAMEYIKGSTLEIYCQKDNLLPLNTALEAILDVCNGLGYAHDECVIHRDIKPSNILLSLDGTAKITDFGIAQMTDKTFTTGIWGTPHYLSPEQIKDETVGFPGDIFSVGCVLYEILTGEKAFPGANSYAVFYNITTQEPVSILSVRPDLPKILDEIVKKALAKDPKDRYQTCAALARDLVMARRGLGTPPPMQEKLKDIVDYLHRLHFFRNFSPEQLRELASLAAVVTVPKGNLIAGEGEIDDAFFIILSGQARVRKGEVDIALVSTGECFGEMACIAVQPRVANVVADTKCILMKMTAPQLDALPDALALLFYKNFSFTLVRRLSNSVEDKR